MIKIPFLVVLMLLAKTQVSGQLSTTASASASAIIITPVGTENSGNRIVGSFYPGKTTGTLELNSNGIWVDGRIGYTDLQTKAETPFFHVLSCQYNFTITVAFDPVMINQDAVNETMLIESFTILPMNENRTEQRESDRFSIGAKFRVGASQVPGFYISPSPYTVTIHFN